MKKAITVCIALVVVILGVLPTGASELKCPRFFDSNMVLQREMPVPVWGWGKVGSTVTVTFAGMSKEAVVDANGVWKTILDPMTASSESRDLIVTSGESKIVMKNVLVGEVWLASGQSNMQWGLGRSSIPRDELKNLNRPLVRIITVRQATSPNSRQDLSGTWQPLNAKSGPSSSAVASYFAMKVQEELNIPVGILSSSWGGTRIEPWTPAEGFDQVPELQSLAKKVRELIPPEDQRKKADQDYIASVRTWLSAAEHEVAEGRTPGNAPQATPPAKVSNKTPAAIYNAMIAPIVGVAMRGALWYQGESNMGEGLLYEKKMQALVGGWRKVWGIGDFPFYFVQLAPFGRYSGTKLGGLWEAQLHASRSIPHCGMAVTTDIGNLKDIHPKNKKDVGERLARWALAKQYGKAIAYSGPLYTSHEVKGSAIHVSFEHSESGLAFKGKAIADVYIQGKDDTEFMKASPSIEGSVLVVPHPNGDTPLHVRMGWNKNAEPNLTNKEGLPASPFRTDK